MHPPILPPGSATVRVQLYTVAVVVSSTRRSYVRILTVTADCRPISEMTTESEIEPPAKRFKQTTLTCFRVVCFMTFIICCLGLFCVMTATIVMRFIRNILTQYTVLEIQQFEYQYDTVLAKIEIFLTAIYNFY